MNPSIRPLRPDDLGRVLEINQANTPEVGSIDSERLAFIYDEAAIRLGTAIGVQLVGFTLVLAPGSKYDSVNYRWFQSNQSDCWYLDRVAITAEYRRRGLGARLYRRVFEELEETPARSLGLEVNVDPPNPASMAFHERLGFDLLAQQTTDYGAVVAMMLRAIRKA